MEFQEIVQKALAVRGGYDKRNSLDGHKVWGTAEYLQGFIGDVGDLAKLIMAKNNYRTKPNVDTGLVHELADCLWSVIVLADSLGIDLEKTFNKTMDEIIERDNLEP